MSAEEGLPVRIPAWLAAHLRRVPIAARREILEGFARLSRDPVARPTNAIRRLRSSVRDAPRPLFYSVTARFGLLHTIVDGGVLAVDVHPRPTVRLKKRS